MPAILSVAVFAVAETTRDDCLFRTYGVCARTEPCSITDACLATSAATTFFPRVNINAIDYVDGAFQNNNPSGAAIAELESDESPSLSPLNNEVAEVKCLVSIGTGRDTFEYKKKGLLSNLTNAVLGGLTSMKDAAQMCIKIATDCHRQHLNVRARFEKAYRTDAYYRFDVDKGLERWK